MEYFSRLGDVCYYDYKQMRPLLSEPTMLFLLGLEAIITPSEEYSLDQICFSRSSIENIFDKVYFYLYGTETPDDIDSIEYDCSDMKRSFSTITGMASDRIVPIIYHNYFNMPIIDDFKVEAEKLHMIFDSAGYNKKDNSVRYISKKAAVENIGENLYFTMLSSENIDSAEEYNRRLREEHEKKKLYSQMYKLLDYKAMYSYALGVLYGCKTLGYTFEFTSTDPSWYDGEYQSLVSTALVTFNFHLKWIDGIDNDKRLHKKYKCIQTNKVWNYKDL
jgi:hypothetical protein